MLNNLSSQIDQIKAKPSVDKYRQQIQAILEQIQEEIAHLSTEVTTQNVVTDTALVNDKITARSVEGDQMLMDLIQARHTILEYLSADNAELTDAEINNLNAITARIINADVDDLNIRGNLSLNTISATTANATSINATGKVTALSAEVTTDVKSNSVHTNVIDAQNITSGLVTSDTVVTQALNASGTITGQTVNANNAGFSNLNGQNSNIINITNTNLTSRYINNSYNRATGTINCDPSKQTVYNWYSFTIPERLHNYTLYLHSVYTDNDSNPFEWSCTVIGNDTCAIITYTEEQTGLIKDFSFDRDTGRFRIRFFADEQVDFKFDYLADEPIELDVEYNQEALITIHEPIKNHGYIFQSYNDDTVEFYFGGAVFVHSLGAEFQEFEKQETKQLYVERNIFLPDIVEDDRSVATWDVGREGSYITNRDDGYGNLITKWEDPIDEIKHVDRLVTSDTVANYDGAVDVTVDPLDPQYEYPIVNLGDNTEVHGDIKVDGNTVTKHIYDGAYEDYPNDMPNQSLVVFDANTVDNYIAKEIPTDYDAGETYYDNSHNEIAVAYDSINDEWTVDGVVTATPFTVYIKQTSSIGGKLTRKTRKNNADKFDELAVYESTFDFTGKNNQPVIYDEANNSLKTSADLTLGDVTVNELVVNKDLHVKGDAFVEGTLHTVEEETITSVGDNIVLRQNNPSSLGNDTSGIIVNNYNGNGDSLELATSSDGTIRVGTGTPTTTNYLDIYKSKADSKWYSDAELTTEITPQPAGYLASWEAEDTTDDYIHYEHAVFADLSATLEPIMTRDEEANLNDQGLLVWDADDTEAKTIALPTNDEDELVPTYSAGTSTTTTVYTDGTNFYGSDMAPTTEPSGTAGTPVNEGEFIYYNDVWFYKDGTDYYDSVDSFTDHTHYTLVVDGDVIAILDTQTPVTISQVTYTEVITPGKWTYSWQPKKAGTYVFATIADYEQYEIDHPGVIPVGSQVIIEANKNYIKSEDIE